MVCVTFTQIPEDLQGSVDRNVFVQVSVRIMKNMEDKFLKKKQRQAAIWRNDTAYIDIVSQTYNCFISSRKYLTNTPSATLFEVILVNKD